MNAVMLTSSSTVVLIFANKEATMFFALPDIGLTSRRSLLSVVGGSGSFSISEDPQTIAQAPTHSLIFYFFKTSWVVKVVGSNSQAGYLQRDSAMDDSIGGS